MSYSKPEIVAVTSACQTIQGKKDGSSSDSANRLSPSAYESDE
jgi:hypothetical protein